MGVAALIVSVLSVAVAVIVALRQDRLQRRIAVIEETRRTEEVLDRQRAELTATFRRDPNPRLLIINSGSAVARDVAFDPEELAQQGVLRVLGIEGLPIASLAPGQEFAFGLVMHDGTELSIRFKLMCKDDSGEREADVTISRL